MSYMLMNPGCLAGSPGNPPEFMSNAAFTCIRCSWEGDLDDDTHFDTPKGSICRDCLVRCSCCGFLVEGEDAVTDVFMFDKVPFCFYCFADELCGDSLDVPASLVDGERYLAALSDCPL